MAYRRASNCLKITLKVFVSLVKEPDERGDYSFSPWKVLHPHSVNPQDWGTRGAGRRVWT